MDARLFVGPQVEKTMEGLTPGLELVKDYGMFTILAKPLYWLLDKIHSLLGNLGLVHRRAGAAAENCLLLAQCQGLRQQWPR